MGFGRRDTQQNDTREKATQPSKNQQSAELLCVIYTEGHNSVHEVLCHYAKCHYAECHYEVSLC
jgi:hypothetical protein